MKCLQECVAVDDAGAANQVRGLSVGFGVEETERGDLRSGDTPDEVDEGGTGECTVAFLSDAVDVRRFVVVEHGVHV